MRTSVRRYGNLAAAMLGWLWSAAPVAATEASDLCTGNPCRICANSTVTPDSELDFGTRAVILCAGATLQLQSGSGSSTTELVAGSFTAEAGSTIAGNASTAMFFLVAEATFNGAVTLNEIAIVASGRVSFGAGPITVDDRGVVDIVQRAAGSGTGLPLPPGLFFANTVLELNDGILLAEIQGTVAGTLRIDSPEAEVDIVGGGVDLQFQATDVFELFLASDSDLRLGGGMRFRDSADLSAGNGRLVMQGLDATGDSVLDSRACTLGFSNVTLAFASIYFASSVVEAAPYSFANTSVQLAQNDFTMVYADPSNAPDLAGLTANFAPTLTQLNFPNPCRLQGAPTPTRTATAVAATATRTSSATPTATRAGTPTRTQTGTPGTPSDSPTPTATAGLPTATPTDSAAIHPTATPPTSRCVGDCDGGGGNGGPRVTVNEIVTMVNIALERAPIDQCLAGDANHDDRITIAEIILAVNNALRGCPA